MTILWGCCWKTCPITSFLAFGFQKHAFNINHVTVCLSEISSGLSVKAYDPVEFFQSYNPLRDSKELYPYSKIIAYFLDCIPKISPLIGNLSIVTKEVGRK